MAYIEKERPGEFFNNVSCTVEINPKNEPIVASEEDENIERWGWLINNWHSMTFKEKMSVFTPYMYIIDLADTVKTEFNNDLNNQIVEVSYLLCRTVNSIKFDPDRKAIPHILVQYNPIDPTSIPNAMIRNDVIAWGTKYGFYKAI